MQPMLNIAVQAARNAGDFLVRRLDRAAHLHVLDKGPNDYVSEADRRAEAIVLAEIRKAYPGHAVLAEESGAQAGNDCQWIVDPLDGTTNFLHGCPHFAVSVAVRRGTRLLHAVVYDPLRQEMYTASRGEGAYLNERRIRVSGRAASGPKGLKRALVGTGFPFRNPARLPAYLDALERVCRAVTDVRRMGSAALDLAAVACGRLDGFWESDLQLWDIAAGVLLVEEAGGLVTDLEGGTGHLRCGQILAGSPAVHGQLLRLLAPSGGRRPGPPRRPGGAGGKAPRPVKKRRPAGSGGARKP